MYKTKADHPVKLPTKTDGFLQTKSAGLVCKIPVKWSAGQACGSTDYPWSNSHFQKQFTIKNKMYAYNTS